MIKLAHALRQRQFLVFVGGGLLCAVLDIGVMQGLLLAGIGISVAAATSAGFAAGLVLNYAFHARVTFGRLHSAAGFLRFLCVVALNYLLTMACVGAALAIARLGLGADAASAANAALAGKLVSLPLVACNGFLLSKYWTFR
ncbi:GtrA family protein [Duganella phyllosphaerae]|uniref:GtrA-like protein n=1 Tax=Duganella phyllosphaerae TaxID=762836 RepID=A0A1E7WCE4_9BURK|nr:GtrA family protein [Duganella phyllosphaerae]OEZ94685.1 GtrA-like protein [Duganella phyllosphaerae]